MSVMKSLGDKHGLSAAETNGLWEKAQNEARLKGFTKGTKNHSDQTLIIFKRLLKETGAEKRAAEETTEVEVEPTPAPIVVPVEPTPEPAPEEHTDVPVKASFELEEPQQLQDVDWTSTNKD